MLNHDDFLVEHIYEEFLEHETTRRKKQGYETLRRNFENHILPYFKDKYVNDITKNDIMKWENIIASRNYSNNFNKILYSCFSSFMNYCVLCDYREDNIVLKVPKFPKKVENIEHDTYNIFEFRKFRHHLDSYIEKQFFNFIFFNGTRPSETMALRFCDLNKNEINIVHSIHRRGNRELDTPKNQSSLRKIHISNLTRYRISKLKKLYIKQYKTFSEDFYIFGGNKPLASSTIDRHKAKACEKAKIRQITQHEFRHSYATRLLAKGQPPDYIGKSMGHTNIAMTLNVYSHNKKGIYNIPFIKWFL